MTKLYPTGTHIANRYEVVKGPLEDNKLEGGMGLVYLCLDHKTEQPVALKTFRPQFMSNRAARDRFLREGSAWVQLGHHPHIVRAYEVVRMDHDRTVFLALEQIATPPEQIDVSLRGWLPKGQPLLLDTALLFGVQIVRGMAHAVETLPGFIHRDLKPENILVGADSLPNWQVNRVRVTDFGLAKVMLDGTSSTLVSNEELTNDDSPTLRNTQLTRGAIGTPLYMAPEQWEGKVAGVTTDIYAVGLILYEMVVGQMAVQGANIAHLRRAHQEGQLRPIPATIPPIVTKLIQRCLEINTVDRYQKWETLLEDLVTAFSAVTGKRVPAPTNLDMLAQAGQIALGWSYHSLGGSYMDIGKLHVALKYFERVKEIGKRNNEPELVMAGLTGLGNIHADFGDPHQAIESYEQILLMTQQMRNRLGECNVLNNLGTAYFQVGDIQQAISYYEQGLTIGQKIGDHIGVGQALGNLGTAYRQLGDSHRAIEFFEQRLTIAKRMGDRQAEGNTLDNLGMAYFQLGDLRRAIVYQEEALTISRQTGNRAGEVKSLGNLGNTYCQLGETQQGITFFEQALDIAQEMGNRMWEDASLNGLGIAYLHLGETKRAIGYFEQGLAVAREIGDRIGEGTALGSLGNAYFQLGNMQQAAIFYQQDLAIAREIGDRTGEAATLVNLGNVYLQMEDIHKAIDYFEQSLPITRETSDRVGQGKAIGNLGNAYRQLGDLIQASSYYEQHLIIIREADDRVGEAITEFNMAVLYNQQGQIDQALMMAKQAAEHFLHLGYTTHLQQTQQLIAQLQGGTKVTDETQNAFNTFQQALSLAAMQQAVTQFPFMAQADFIAAIEQAIAQRVPPEQQPYFEQRLAWLRQIAQEQNQ